jgi:hypothetical protein
MNLSPGGQQRCCRNYWQRVLRSGYSEWTGTGFRLWKDHETVHWRGAMRFHRS